MRLLRTALKHPEIYPLLGAVSVAGCMAVYCGVRACVTYPDVVWNHKTNPEPWNQVRQNEQIKMYQTHDYISNRPELPKVE